ncbi:Cathepsin G [Lamprotornis superbus]|uniref:Cathepsin G n=1 Tax=Lamprotornis superbus TaxID=245042 RepID=A0A835NJ24_9PASS|nr:Cathepsin G [Lamprotornis superbus]
MAFLKIRVSNQSVPETYHCGGFLIRPDAVLSAAHCVAKKGRVRVTVILGAHNVNVRERSQQRIHVRDWVIHPKYSPGDIKNDIVLLKLKPRARINENVKFISFSSSKERGDSGGPLVCNHKAHGIVSHGLERSLFPTVFTRISYFEPWIRYKPD